MDTAVGGSCTRRAPSVFTHARCMAAIENLRTGTPVETDLLSKLGFVPYALRFRAEVSANAQCEWDTVGLVPDAAGVYAFVLGHVDWPSLHVVYVGKTSHLWMVTKGTLPRGGGARAGNRYGRHKYAGATRVRVNALVAEARQSGCDVTHWLSPRPSLSASQLGALEEDLIAGWRLRETGWNVG